MPHILLIHPQKEEVEYIKNLRSITIGKVLIAYEEHYKDYFNSEKTKVYFQIEKMLSVYPINLFIRGDQSEPKCKSSKLLLECMTKM